MCSRIEKQKTKLGNKREDIEQGEPVYNASNVDRIGINLVLS